MRQKKINGVNIAMLRRESGEVLAQDANRLRLMEAIMICLTPLLLYITLLSTWQAAIIPMLEKWIEPSFLWLGDVAFWLILVSLTLFFTFPLLSGLLWLASRMEAGEETWLPDVFHAFSNGAAYRSALRISAALLWKVVLFSVVEVGIYSLFWVLGNGWIPFMILSIPVLIGAAFLLVFWFCGGFLRTYFVMCIQNSAGRMRPYARSAGFSYWMGFLPWLALSLLTFCILLLADVLPRMLIAYFRLCRKLDEMTVQSEE